MEEMITKGNSGFTHKAPFLDELQLELEKDFNTAFGQGGKNTKFKKQEIENLIYLKENAFGGSASLKFVFIDKTGNIKTFDEDSFMSMDWRHIESGMDFYEDGVLWLSTPNRENGMMDDMLLTSKKEAYTKLFTCMKKNEKKYEQIEHMDVLCWELILKTWDEHFDDNLNTRG